MRIPSDVCSFGSIQSLPFALRLNFSATELSRFCELFGVECFGEGSEPRPVVFEYFALECGDRRFATLIVAARTSTLCRESRYFKFNAFTNRMTFSLHAFRFVYHVLLNFTIFPQLVPRLEYYLTFSSRLSLLVAKNVVFARRFT